MCASDSSVGEGEKSKNVMVLEYGLVEEYPFSDVCLGRVIKV